MGQCRPLYQLSNQSRRPTDAQQISRNLLPESLSAWLSPQHVALRSSPLEGGISAGSAGDCRIVNPREDHPACSRGQRTFTQMLFSWVNSRITEKPISRPYPLCL